MSLSHGPYPEVSRLNPDFVTGVSRLKITLKLGPHGHPPAADGYLASLETLFPSLSRHRCCGDNSLRESLFLGGRRESCAVEDHDPGVDVAHLAEHLIIDMQHFVGRMRICSGVTCAYREPRNMYDIFVECPEEKVGSLSASVALGIVNDLLEGRPPPDNTRCLMEAARVARDRTGDPVRYFVQDLERQWGASATAEALDYLVLQGYLTELQATLNFSGEPILFYRP